MTLGDATAAMLREALITGLEQGKNPRGLVAMLRDGHRVALVEVRPAEVADGPKAAAEAMALAPTLGADELILATGGAELDPRYAHDPDDPRAVLARLVLELRFTRAGGLTGSVVRWDPEAGTYGAEAIENVQPDSPVPLAMIMAGNGVQPAAVGAYALTACWNLAALGHRVIVTRAGAAVVGIVG